MLEQPERWVCRSGHIPWLANSLEFVQLSFFFIWRRLKRIVSAAELTGAAELHKSENTYDACYIVTSLEVLRECGNI